MICRHTQRGTRDLKHMPTSFGSILACPIPNLYRHLFREQNFVSGDLRGALDELDILLSFRNMVLFCLDFGRFPSFHYAHCHLTADPGRLSTKRDMDVDFFASFLLIWQIARSSCPASVRWPDIKCTKLVLRSRTSFSGARGHVDSKFGSDENLRRLPHPQLDTMSVSLAGRPVTVCRLGLPQQAPMPGRPRP